VSHPIDAIISRQSLRTARATLLWDGRDRSWDNRIDRSHDAEAPQIAGNVLGQVDDSLPGNPNRDGTVSGAPTISQSFDGDAEQVGDGLF
jgi:hypothetical protein